MKRFMQMLLASFGVMALMLAGCSSTDDTTDTDTTGEETMGDDTTTGTDTVDTMDQTTEGTTEKAE